LIPLLLAAALGCLLPSGEALWLAGPVTVDAERAGLLRSFGLGEAFVRVADTPERLWLSFALAGAGPFRWPAGLSLAVRLKDGRELWAGELAAITPEARLIHLGGMPVSLPADALERRRFREHGICAVLFGSFPGSLIPGEIAGVRVGVSPNRAGPHPGPAGGP